MRPRRLILLLILGLLGLWGASPPLYAQTPRPQLWWVSYADDADLARLTAELDVWEVDHLRHVLLAPLTPEAAADLAKGRTLELHLDQSPLEITARAASQTSGIPGYPCYRTVDETNLALDDLAARYPELARVEPIGQSWDALNAPQPAGDTLRVLIITNRRTQPPQGETKPRLFLMGAIHARELTTAETALRFGEMLLAEYGHNPETTWLLDRHELHILPIANPDGRRIAETGLLWRKNTNTSAACSVSLPSFSYGVDLNRNAGFQWDVCTGCSSSDACSQIYRGPAPNSEPETQAIASYLRRIFPDRRPTDLAAPAPDDTSGLMISLHSYSELILFPWGWTASAAPNGRQLATLARRFGAPLGYPACAAPACLYPTDGSVDDWVYGELGVPGFTFELGTAFFQACSDFESNIWPGTQQALRYGLRVAGQPYSLPGGPATLDLLHPPATVNVGMPVTVTATADSQILGTLIGDESLRAPARTVRRVAAAVDTLPQHAAATIELAADDGTFDSAREAVTGSIDTSCLETGRHTLLVQAQDDVDQWGPPAAGFITVTNGSPFTLTTTIDTRPRITTSAIDPHVYANSTVSYTLSITNTGTVATEYTIRGASAWPLTFPLTTTAPVAPRQSVTVTYTVAIPKNSAGTSVPAAITLYATDDPTACRHLVFDLVTPAWWLAFPTLHLPNPPR